MRNEGYPANRRKVSLIFRASYIRLFRQAAKAVARSEDGGGAPSRVRGPASGRSARPPVSRGHRTQTLSVVCRACSCDFLASTSYPGYDRIVPPHLHMRPQALSCTLHLRPRAPDHITCARELAPLTHKPSTGDYLLPLRLCHRPLLSILVSSQPRRRRRRLRLRELLFHRP